jgi:hypothetical protein
MDFPYVRVVELQGAPIKCTWMKVIGQALGHSRFSQKFLLNHMKLHIHKYFQLVKLFTQGFFEIVFMYEKGTN